MITAIYFKDDFVKEGYVDEDTTCIGVCGKFGLSDAFRKVDYFGHTVETNFKIFTNNPLIVDDVREVANISWNNIYLFDFNKNEYIAAKKFTNKDLRKSHIFSRLWIGGEFKDSHRKIIDAEI